MDNTKTRILVVQESDWLKEGPHQQHQLMDRLSLKSHEISVIDYEIQWRRNKKKELFSRRQVFGRVSKVFERANVTLIRPGIIKIPLLVYLSLLISHRKEISRQIKELKPDIIVAFGILNAYLAMRAARKAGIPFVYYWIDVLHTLIPFKPAQPLGKIIEATTLRNADRIITINDKLTDYVIRAGAAQERTFLIRAGIDPNHFKLSISGEEIREAYGIGKDDLVLFFMGWLYHFSGLKEVALELAEMRNHDIKLLILGEGDAYEELQEIQERYGLKDKLILIDKKPYEAVPGFIAACDICLLPAYPDEKVMQDIVPIKMYEYMAMKKPVIATKLPGVIKEFGEDNGVVYVDRPEDIVGKAIELVQNGKVDELSAKARGFVERYSWDTTTDEFERILEEAVEAKQDERIP